MSKQKIYFKGYYGYENIGDDIFCVTADWVCNKVWKNKKPVFIGKKLPLLSNNAIKFESKSPNIRRIAELLRCFTVDQIIYFGGSVFHSKVNGIKDLKFFLKNFKFFNKKVGTIGTSIGPFKTDEDKNSIITLLSKFNFIALRDKSSLGLLKNNTLIFKAKPTMSFDLAVLIKDIYPSLNSKSNVNGVKTNKLKIAVSLCHYERYVNGDILEEEKREKSVENFLKLIIQKYEDIEEIVFFEFNGAKNNGDKEITSEFNSIFHRKVKTKIVEYNQNTKKFCEELNECDFLIGIRLHSAILAYSLNIPFLLVEYHVKCTEFLNTINNNYRYLVNDSNNNIENFGKIMEKRHVPGIVDPEYFRDILKKEIEDIGIKNNL